MVNSNILYRRSLEHALSWLSTLGGAFSALGDLSSTWVTKLQLKLKLFYIFFQIINSTIIYFAIPGGTSRARKLNPASNRAKAGRPRDPKSMSVIRCDKPFAARLLEKLSGYG